MLKREKEQEREKQCMGRGRIFNTYLTYVLIFLQLVSTLLVSLGTIARQGGV